MRFSRIWGQGGGGGEVFYIAWEQPIGHRSVKQPCICTYVYICMEYRVACRREDNGWRWKATCQTVTRVHVFTHESSSRAPRVQVGSNRSPFRRPNPLRHGYSIVPFNVTVTQYAAAFACTHSISSLPPPALNHFQSRYFGSRFSLGGSRRCEAPRHVATFPLYTRHNT